MSAFIVDKKHIDALCKFAKQQSMAFNFEDRLLLASRDMDKIGQILVNENHRSINYRYSENEQPYQYKYSDHVITTLSPIQIIKACGCYVYQTCETPDHEETLAIKIVNKIDALAFLVGGYSAKGISRKKIYDLPTYDSAKYEIIE